MDTFESIWHSSRTNAWSGIYPCLIGFGIAFLFALAFIRREWFRRTLMVLVSIAFAYAVAEVSFRSLQEKWLIRSEWTRENWDSLTQGQQDIAIADGANLVMGGPINGVFALCCFGVTILIIKAFRRCYAGAKIGPEMSG